MAGDQRHNVRLIEDLGLVPYLAERFGIVGTPEDCVEQVQRAVAAGATQICLRPQVADKGRFFQAWTGRIMPRVG